MCLGAALRCSSRARSPRLLILARVVYVPTIEVDALRTADGPSWRTANCGDEAVGKPHPCGCMRVNCSAAMESQHYGDYLRGAGSVGHFEPVRSSEGPVFFKRDGRYYIITGSACTWWD